VISLAKCGALSQTGPARGIRGHKRRLLGQLSTNCIHRTNFFTTELSTIGIPCQLKLPTQNQSTSSRTRSIQARLEHYYALVFSSFEFYFSFFNVYIDVLSVFYILLRNSASIYAILVLNFLKFFCLSLLFFLLLSLLLLSSLSEFLNKI
jgi:hypothetical protein